MCKQRLLFTVVVAVLATMSSMRVAQGVPVLDQEHDPTGTLSPTGGFFGGFDSIQTWLAQTFTVGVSGKLSSVEVFVTRFPENLTANMVVEIRPVVGGLPDGNPGSALASVTVPNSAVPAVPVVDFVGVDLTPFSVDVVAGESLAIMWTGTGTVTEDGFNSRGSQDNSYVIGTGFSAHTLLGSSAIPSHLWGAGFDGQNDWGFRTFVDPIAVPEPGTLGLFVAGLVGLGFLRRKRTA